MSIPSNLKCHLITIKPAPDYTEETQVYALVVPVLRSPFRDTVIGGSTDLDYKLLLDPDVDISTRDLIIWNGRTFIVEAAVVDVPDPRDLDSIHHKECMLKEYSVA